MTDIQAGDSFYLSGTLIAGDKNGNAVTINGVPVANEPIALFGPVPMKMPAHNTDFIWGVLGLASLNDMGGRVIVPAPGHGNKPWGLALDVTNGFDYYNSGGYDNQLLPEDIPTITIKEWIYRPVVLAVRFSTVLLRGSGVAAVLSDKSIVDSIEQITLAALTAANIPPLLVDNRKEVGYGEEQVAEN